MEKFLFAKLPLMIFKQNLNRSLSGAFFISIIGLCCVCPAESQMAPLSSYEVEAEAPTVKENYNASRKTATNRAMRKLRIALLVAVFLDAL